MSGGRKAVARRRGRGTVVAGLVAALCLGAAPSPARGQQAVGHEPENSPYRDIADHQGFTLFVGHFDGAPGPAGVGPQSATAFGARLQIRLSNPIDLWATIAEARSSRLVLDASTDTAKSLGTKPLSFLMYDLGLALNLTGDKTWHGLAPYVGVGLGVATPSQVKIDPGGFQLGTSFALMPTIGTRWFVLPPLAIHLEVRDYLWRIQYPLQFYNSYYYSGTTATPILHTGISDRMWTHDFVFWAGASYTFTF